MNQHKGSTYAVPQDDHKAAELAMRDARRVQELWALHGKTRALTARLHIAQEARYLEEHIVRTADTLIERAAGREQAQ